MRVILSTYSATGHCTRMFYPVGRGTDFALEMSRAEDNSYDAERGDETLIMTADLIVTRFGDGSGVVTHHLRRADQTDYHAAIIPLLHALNAHALRLVEVEKVGGEWQVRQAPPLALRDTDDHDAGRTLRAHTVPAELVERSAFEPSRGTVPAAVLAQSIAQRWTRYLRFEDWVGAPTPTGDEHAEVSAP